jgi:TolB-like protein/Flp pilus assembly protein TadD
MAANPNKLPQFWQELKRRKVIRTITVYAAAAFVILELLSIIIEPLKLPDWTLQFAIVFLCIGFVVAIILSWIYDIHPEGGIVKTESAHSLDEEIIPMASQSWKIASYISFVVIVALVVLNIIPRVSRSEEKAILDKSIAVLPFINESSDKENSYFINGVMESVLNNLSKIEELRVISRNSVEQYRNNPKPTPVVAEEMNASYILEGSGQKLGNRILLTIQLIAGADDNHLWSKQYDREIKQVEDLLDIQIEISQLVANELEAIIKPVEKQRIEKLPTRSLTAYDFYQRGYEEEWRFIRDNDKAALGRAESFSDSTLILADIALLYDNQLAEAHEVKGLYYRGIGKTEKAIAEYKRAIELNPNYYIAFWGLGNTYLLLREEIDQAIYYFSKASHLHRGENLPTIYGQIAEAYRSGGFKEQAITYDQLVLELDADSAKYLMHLAWMEGWQSNFQKAIQYAEQSYLIDTSNTNVLYNLGYYFMRTGQHIKSLAFYQDYERRMGERGTFFSYAPPRMG